METTSNNELIHKFMGHDWTKEQFEWRPGSSSPMTIKHLEYYQTSWQWLMPCWAKFVKQYHELGRKQTYHPTRKLRSEFSDAIDRGDILKCYEILVDGIKWVQSVK